jgi:hypothetical protein
MPSRRSKRKRAPVADARIFRYEVPVDDEWHGYDLRGAVFHVAGRRTDVVEFWALHKDMPSYRREFRVFGTGQPLEDGRYVGTVVHSALVWHLFVRDEAPGVSE